MNKKTKLRYRAVLSLILSAVLFCMPAMAFSMNGNNAIDVRAEDSGESSTEEETGSSTEENTTEESSTEQEQRAVQGKLQRSRQKAAQRAIRRTEPYQEMMCRSRCVPVRKSAAHMTVTRIVKCAPLITGIASIRHQMW